MREETALNIIEETRGIEVLIAGFSKVEDLE